MFKSEFFFLSNEQIWNEPLVEQSQADWFNIHPYL